MEHIEIIFKNIKNAEMEEVFCASVLFDVKDIITSHFYNKEKNMDVSYYEIGNLKEYFNSSGTCNIYLKKALMGIELENVLVLISCDDGCCDLTVDFDDIQFENDNIQELKSELKRLLTFLLNIYQNGKVEEIILGYEPADDEDMKVLEISKSRIEIYNDNIYKSQLVRTIYDIAKDVSI